MAATPDAFEPAAHAAAGLDPAAAAAREAAIDAARSALETAPVPGWVVTTAGVHANRAAARWAQALDHSLPDTAGPLPAGHALADAVHRAARQALAEGGSAPLALGLLAHPARITAHALGEYGAVRAGSNALAPDPARQTPGLPLVAWLQLAAPFAGDDPQTLAERLSLAVESANVGLWELDIASGRATWNAQQYALMQLPGDSPPPTFEDWLARVHPDDRAGVVAGWQAFLASGERYETSYRLLHADGTVSHLRAQALAIKDPQGRVIRAVGSNRDVTADWRSARERDELLKRLQLATRIAHVGVWETHLGERRELLDDATCRMLGFGPGPQARPSADFVACVHPDDRARLLDEHAQILAGQRPEATALAFRILREGEERHLLSHISVERAADGRAQRLLGTVFDVTELRHAEQSVRAAVERLQTATQLGGISLFERDAQDRLIYFDGVLKDIYGRTPGGRVPTIEEGIARVVPEDRDSFIEARARMKLSDAPVRCEYRGRHDDGSVHDVLSWRRRRIDAQGHYAGEIGALIDITELRAAERRATELASRLELAQASAGIGVWDWNLRDGSVIWDERMYALYDLPPGTPISLEFFRGLVPPEELRRINIELEHALRDDRPFDLEFRIRSPAGRQRTIAARGEVVARDDAGRPTRMTGASWDVTERRAAEAAAGEAAERLQLAALGAGIGSWERAIDRETGIWDEQMYRLFGVTADAGTPSGRVSTPRDERRCAVANSRSSTACAGPTARCAGFRAADACGATPRARHAPSSASPGTSPRRAPPTPRCAPRKPPSRPAAPRASSCRA